MFVLVSVIEFSASISRACALQIMLECLMPPWALRLVHVVGTHSSKLWSYTRRWVKSVA